jgi:uncharacterized iron-regulated protein
MRKLLIGMVLCGLAALKALPAVAQSPPHPLAGKIVDTRTGAITEMTDPALIPKLFPCGAITLLGEVHDNGEHHRMRGDLVRPAVARPEPTCRTGSFVFEHFSADQQAKVDRIESLDENARRLATAGDLFGFVEWEKSGWPPSTLFAPLMQEVVSSRRAILAGNPSRILTRNAAKEGLPALDPELRRLLGLDQPLAADLEDDLLGELEASHCGLMPKTAFGNMAAAQRYRDAHMAEVALEAAAARGNVIVFAGNGHVRTDRGIPWYIRQRAPDRKVISVAFVETEDGKTDPTAYRPQDPAGKPAADYVAFALPATRDDPCEQMRKHMKK